MTFRGHDLTGKSFGRLTALERAPHHGQRRGAFWRCRCCCGAERVVRADALTQARVLSCGCLRADNGSAKAAAMREKLAQKGAAQQRQARVLASIFRPPPDTVHVDRPGARIVRGGRY